jgi:protein-serine/threonine kinase
MTEHEHGLGASGLRRIRQQPPMRPPPTLPSSQSSSRKTSMTLTRSSSMIITPGPASPPLNFTEDLSRFPSESLHSFSFAHQSEEFIHNRQNVLKRSVEFMSQKLGLGTTNAGIASAQARLSGDQEMQGMLELLARANLVGANNIPGFGQSHLTGPLTGPAGTEDAGNVFDSSFAPQSPTSEAFFESPQNTPPLTRKTFFPPPTVPEDQFVINDIKEESPAGPQTDSESSSRTPTNESRTTAKTSPPVTRRQSLKRTFTDTAPLTLQNKLMDALAQPFLTGDSFHEPLLSPPLQQSFAVSGPHPLGPACTAIPADGRQQRKLFSLLKAHHPSRS